MTSSVPEPTVQTPKSLIAICQWCLPNPEISGLTQARTLGFDGVQLDLGIQTDTRNLTEPAKLSACLAAVKDSGLSVPTLGLNYVALNRSDQETTICRILDQSLAIAAKLGAKTLQLCSFWEGGMHSAEAFAHTVRHLRYICHQAEAYDLVIGSENDLDLTGNQKLLDAVSYPNFGIYFDTANPWLYTRADALLMLQTLYPDICEVHVKDFTLDPEPVCVPLGQGDCRAADAMAILKHEAYDKWLVLENRLPAPQLEQDQIWLRQA